MSDDKELTDLGVTGAVARVMTRAHAKKVDRTTKAVVDATKDEIKAEKQQGRRTR